MCLHRSLLPERTDITQGGTVPAQVIVARRDDANKRWKVERIRKVTLENLHCLPPAAVHSVKYYANVFI